MHAMVEDTQSNIFEMSQVDFYYTLGKTRVHALQNVSVCVASGSICCLIGPSGSGKSTLLNLLGLLDTVQSGTLKMRGRNVSELSEQEQNRLRRYEIGFVFQNFHLLPILTAEENVEFFLTRQGIAKQERADRVRKALEKVGLWEQRKQKPFEMSGGQRQRVAIARALAKAPQVIIADEPTANLDQATGLEIMNIFKTLAKQDGVSIIIASHDPMVIDFADQKIILRDGKIVPAAISYL